MTRRLKIEVRFLPYIEKHLLIRRYITDKVSNYEPLAQRGWRAGISSVDFTRCVRNPSALFFSFILTELGADELHLHSRTTVLTLTYTVAR
jgi:hypothetical protein